MCHVMVAKVIDLLSYLLSIKIFHYMDYIMLNSECFAKLAKHLNDIKMHLREGGWKINTCKVKKQV